jgi:aspartyl-tRNA(Asn)/glutamyl-tRNA(Gln) amidotransferase subunit A
MGPALCVAWYADDGTTLVAPEVRSAVEDAASALRDAGAAVEEGRPPHVERATELWLKLFSYATQEFLRRTYAGHEDEAGPVASLLLKRAAGAGAPALDEYFGAWEERDRLRGELLEWMESTPLVIAPVGAVAAPLHDARKVSAGGREFGVFQAFGYAQAFNVFDLPAASVRAGWTGGGLPVGVQVVGRPRAESEVLAAARVVEEALGGWRNVPENLSKPRPRPL